jgi:hypothetical protein
MMITEGEADIYLKGDEKDFNFDACLIVAMPEFGFAPYVAVKGVLNGADPIGHYISKYHFQDPFNCIGDFSDPGWPLYCIEKQGKKWLIVVIKEWMPTPLIQGAPQGTWIYTYPLVRNFCSLLIKRGVKDLCYATTTAGNDAFPDELFTQPKRTRVYEYHFGEGTRTTSKAFVLPPSWLFPYLFTEMGGEGWLVFTGYKEGDMIDDMAATTLTNYFKNHLHLPSSRAEMDRTCERIKEEVTDEVSMMDAIPDMKKLSKTDRINPMWG